MRFGLSTPLPRAATRLVRVAALALLVLPWLLAVAGANPYINMGAGGFMLGQPEVQIMVYTPDDPATPADELVIYGPDEFHNRFILDTGANGLMIAQGVYGSALEEMTANGFVDQVCFYEESGVAGASLYGVSAAYDLDYAGSDGLPQGLTGVRFMCDAEAYIEYDGIIGMPAMAGQVVVLDMTPWLPGDLGPMMTTTFADTAPADTAADRLYTVPLTMVPFAQSGQLEPGDPLPTWAPLPFLQATVFEGSAQASGPFLLDTGAQLSMISTALAIGLGLDANGNGQIDADECSGYVPIGGVGGTIQVPLVSIDGMRVATADGVDLVWRDFEVLVLDITPEIQGIFAMDLMHSGWMSRALGDPSQPPGAINLAYLDFRAVAGGTASLVLEINADNHVVLAADAPLPAITHPGEDLATAGPLQFSIAWDQVVEGFSAADLVLTNGTLDSFVEDLPGQRYVAMVTPAAVGGVRLAIPGFCCQNAAGSGNGPGSDEVAYDPTAARATLSTTATSPTAVAPIPFRVEFDGLVLDFAEEKLSVSNGTVSDFEMEGGWLDFKVGTKGLFDLSYTFNVTPLANGEVTVAVPTQVADGFTTLSSYLGDRVTVHFTGFADPPAVTITAAVPSPTAAAAIPFTIAFDRQVLGFEGADLAIANGTLAAFVETAVGRRYEVSVEPLADGLVTLTLPAGAAHAAGQPNPLATLSVESDRTAPEAAVSRVDLDTLTVVFSEPMDGADDPANYHFVPPLEVLDVAPDAGAYRLTTARQDPTVTYALSFGSPVDDGAGNVPATPPPLAAEDDLLIAFHVGSAADVAAAAGTAAAASAAYDAGYDLPAAGGTATPVLQFVAAPGDPGAVPLSWDLRAPAAVSRWHLQVTPAGKGPVTFAWTFHALAAGRLALLQRLSGQSPTGPVLDMTVSDAITVAEPALFLIVCGTPQTATVTLTRGWNLVGVPLVSAMPASAGLVDGAGAPLFIGVAWRLAAGALVPQGVSLPLSAERGYWLFSPGGGVSLPFCGLPEDGVSDLHPGWNLLTPQAATSCADLAPGALSVWEWHPALQAFRRVSADRALLPGVAYYILMP